MLRLSEKKFFEEAEDRKNLSFSHITGSIPEAGQLVGTIEFFEEGAVCLTVKSPEQQDPDVVHAFQATADFVLYALTRADWMGEFFSKALDEDIPFSHKNTSKSNAPNLTLIKGGKEE